MTTTGLQKKLDSKKKKLKTEQRKHRGEWFKGEGELVHDIELLKRTLSGLEKLEQELTLLKT